jgi:hypothetical protein
MRRNSQHDRLKAAAGRMTPRPDFSLQNPQIAHIFGRSHLQTIFVDLENHDSGARCGVAWRMDPHRSTAQAAAYRQRARSCIEDALRMTSDERREVMLELAFLWAKLARLSERAHDHGYGAVRP